MNKFANGNQGQAPKGDDYADSKMSNLLHTLHLRRLLAGLMWKEIEALLSGNEVYYTACSLLVIFKKSCSQLYCQIGLIHFHFYIRLFTLPKTSCCVWGVARNWTPHVWFLMVRMASSAADSWESNLLHIIHLHRRLASASHHCVSVPGYLAHKKTPPPGTIQ